MAALFALMSLFVMGTLSLRVSSSELGVMSQAKADAEALALAEAAVNAAEAYLRSLPSPPVNTITYPPSGVLTLATGTCKASIARNPNPFDPWTNYYTITGEGTSKRLNFKRTVIGQFSPISFSLYGYFEDTGLSNNWWVSKLSKFDGPFHSNGKMQIDWTKNNATANDIIFNGTFSSVNSSIKWGSAGAPQTDNDWKKFAKGGKSACTLGVDAIPYPSVSDEQKQAAWGSDSNYPATADVYLNAVVNTAGIYINSGGQNCTVTFSVAADGGQVISIGHKVKNAQNQWVDRITEITTHLASNYTSVRTKTGTGAFTAPTNYSGVPNGVIYCTGEIHGLSGTLANNYVDNGKIKRPNYWTIASEFSNTTSGKKNVTITNNLQYTHLPDYVNYRKTDAYNLEVPALGVIGYQVEVDTACPTNLTLHGVYMGVGNLSTGSIRVNDIDARRLRGQMNIFGGTIVKSAAILGQYNPSTMQLVYGYQERYSYDVRMADGPLVAFPKTNQYAPIAWQYQ